MTTKDKIEEIRKACIEANPEIVEFKFGCEVIREKELIDWAKRVTLIARNDKKGLEYYRELDGSVFCVRGLKDIKIIGRPIRLADIISTVLELTNKNCAEDLAYGYWNLRHDSLDWHAENSPQTISFIHNVLI